MRAVAGTVDILGSGPRVSYWFPTYDILYLFI